jgi:hypothetical protein
MECIPNILRIRNSVKKVQIKVIDDTISIPLTNKIKEALTNNPNIKEVTIMYDSDIDTGFKKNFLLKGRTAINYQLI